MPRSAKDLAKHAEDVAKACRGRPRTLPSMPRSCKASLHILGSHNCYSSYFICLFLSIPSYYKFVTFFHSLHSFLSQKSLSLSLSLSLNVLVDFYFLLHLCFRLINFCVFRNSNLGWYNLVWCFKLLLLFCSLIVKFYPITL